MSLLHTIFEETPVEQQALLHLTFLYFMFPSLPSLLRVHRETYRGFAESLLRIDEILLGVH